MAGKKWSDTEIQILMQDSPWYSKQIIDQLSGRSWDAIKLMAGRLGLTYDVPCTALTIGRLLEETPEAYYWNGFLLADAHFQERGTISFCLGLEDIEQLKRFGSFIGKEKIVRCNERGMEIIVQSRRVSSALMKKFDYKHDKTYHPPVGWQYPSLTDELLISHLIGYIDGDGSIIKQHSSKVVRHRISFRVHSSWKDWMIGYAKEISKRIRHSTGNPHLSADNYVIWDIANVQAVYHLRDFVVLHNLPVLARKWKKIK